MALGRIVVDGVLGCLCPRDGAVLSDVPLHRRVALALAFALAAIASGGVFLWVLGGPDCDPPWTVDRGFRSVNSMACDNWRAFARTFGLD
jgi:hypothetical protein